MTLEIIIALAVAAAALGMFVSEILPVDIAAFCLLLLLMVLGLIMPASFPSIAEALSGLANPATITVLAMFVLSAGIQKTGLVHAISRRVFGVVGNSEVRQLLAIFLIITPISGFVNNTAAVAMLLPLVYDMARRAGTGTARLLIPLSFFGMMGGMLTLVGTSTSVLVSSMLVDTPGVMRQLSFFEFSALGVVISVVGLIYFLLIGRFLLPAATSAEEAERGTSFFAEVEITEKSRSVGKTLEEFRFEGRHDVRVHRLVRGKVSFIKERYERPLEAGDVLLVEGEENDILALSRRRGVKVLLNFDPAVRRRAPGTGRIIRVMVRGTRLHGRGLSDFDFFRRVGGAVLGVHLDSVPEEQRLGSVPLRVGEVLLVHASLAAFRRISASRDLLVLGAVEEEFSPHLGLRAVSVVGGVVLASALGVPVVLAALAGVVSMFVFRVLKKEEVYGAVNWEVIFLLAGVIPLGIAMTKSGAADFLAGGLLAVASAVPPIILLGLVYLLTTLLTEIVSNNAAAVILVPVVAAVAAGLGLPALPFALAVMFAASTSFLTPMGYQTNTMVYASGVYRFFDFFRVGAPLNLLLLVVTTLGIGWIWGVGW